MNITTRIAAATRIWATDTSAPKFVLIGPKVLPVPAWMLNSAMM